MACCSSLPLSLSHGHLVSRRLGNERSRGPGTTALRIAVTLTVAPVARTWRFRYLKVQPTSNRIVGQQPITLQDQIPQYMKFPVAQTGRGRFLAHPHKAEVRRVVPWFGARISTGAIAATNSRAYRGVRPVKRSVVT